MTASGKRSDGAVYSKVDRRIWGDRHFRALSDDGRLLFMYLLTCPECTTLPGFFTMGKAQLAECMGWSVERLGEPLGELLRKPLIRADWEARFLWLPNGIKRNPPDNPNVVVSWAKEFDKLPECDLKDEALQTLTEYCEQLGEPYAKPFTERLPERLDKPYGEPEAGTGTGTEAGAEPLAGDWRTGKFDWYKVVACWDDLSGAMASISAHRHETPAKEIAKACRALNGDNPREPLEDMVTAWLADPWVQKEKPNLSHLASNTQKYTAPPDPEKDRVYLDLQERWKAEQKLFIAAEDDGDKEGMKLHQGRMRSLRAASSVRYDQVRRLAE